MNSIVKEIKTINSKEVAEDRSSILSSVTLFTEEIISMNNKYTPKVSEPLFSIDDYPYEAANYEGLYLLIIDDKDCVVDENGHIQPLIMKVDSVIRSNAYGTVVVGNSTYHEGETVYYTIKSKYAYSKHRRIMVTYDLGLVF